MDNRWVMHQAASAENKQADRVDPSAPLTGCRGSLIGRLIVEQFEADDPSGDGICFKIHYPAAGEDITVAMIFARDLARKVSARLDRR
jgi:hypothetical protein